MKPVTYSLMVAAMLGQLRNGLSQITINRQPANLSVSIGADAIFQVSAAGSAPFSYQWRFAAMDITN